MKQKPFNFNKITPKIIIKNDKLLPNGFSIELVLSTGQKFCSFSYNAEKDEVEMVNPEERAFTYVRKGNSKKPKKTKSDKSSDDTAKKTAYFLENIFPLGEHGETNLEKVLEWSLSELKEKAVNMPKYAYEHCEELALAMGISIEKITVKQLVKAHYNGKVLPARSKYIRLKNEEGKAKSVSPPPLAVLNVMFRKLKDKV